MTQAERNAAREFGRLLKDHLPDADLSWGPNNLVTFEVVMPDRSAQGSFNPRDLSLSYVGETDNGREGIFGKELLAETEGLEAALDEFDGAFRRIAQWLS